MAYIYQVSFTIQPAELPQLEIGAPLQRTLAYLRALLPSFDGFVNARAAYSLDDPQQVRIEFASVWDTWAQLKAHGESGLAENKVLAEFSPHMQIENLASRVYAEVN